MKDQRGFTLIELLITVAVIGIIAAIAIPNVLNAMHRGKQKRTMADVRAIATAVEAYNVDNAAYPSATDATVLMSNVRHFLNTPITADGWGRALQVDSAPVRYTVGSGGRDGGTLNVIGGPTSSLDDAIIYSNGRFLQWPQGAQTD
jgi:type II secretion system protein G